MQVVSKEFKESMKKPLRNRGYIKVTIGVYNQVAQKNAEITEANNSLAWWSNNTGAFNGEEVTREYATGENNFSTLDGTKYFIPDTANSLYNGGIISNSATGKIIIDFGSQSSLDIKGWTIDFGECYPLHFYIIAENTSKEYYNSSRYFTTEDVFNGTTTVTIQAIEMANGNNRLRILKFDCGIVNTFTNKQVLSYSWKDYASSITDSIPSQDMTITLDNQDLYYSPDNPDSTLAYMELGQKMAVAFGYDVNGDGNVTWLNDVAAYLKTWTADEQQAKFTATDIFDYELTGTYTRGKYYANGTTLYALAEDVFDDAGISSDSYFLDPYLKSIVVYNPLPSVTHAKALQIIANAGRCCLSLDRDDKIRLQSSYVPSNTVTANNIASWGSLDDLLVDTVKDAIADGSQDFSMLNDSTLYFLPTDYAKEDITIYDVLPVTLNQDGFGKMKSGEFDVYGERRCGYVSESYYDGSSWVGDMPVLTVQFEAAWTFIGMLFKFRNTYPAKINITTYYYGTEVLNSEYSIDSLEYLIPDEFALCDKIVVSFTEGSTNSRIHLDSLLIGDVTDYHLSRTYDIIGTATAERNSKIKSISVVRYDYSDGSESKKLTSKKLTLSADSEETITLTNDSYGYSVSVDDADVTATITESSAHFCKIKFTVPDGGATFTCTLNGYEYLITTSDYIVSHNDNGETITWKNPLISTEEHASKIEEWLSDYYLGDVSYTVPYRGDPRVDANDLFYLELKEQDEETLIRAYQCELKFSGSWSGTLKARKADLSWQ